MSDLSFPPPTGTLGPETPQSGRVRRVIAVGGGRGGVGKTLVSVNLGVYFAQLGRDVVICDADPFGSSMYTVLGLAAPPTVKAEAIGEGTVEPVSTTVPGLLLLPAAYEPLTMTPERPSRAAHWLRQIQTLDADYVIVHLGPSIAPASLELFASADVGIAITAPEPLAVESTYRFMRALYMRALRRALTKERYKLRLVEKAAEALPPLAGPRELIAELRRYDDAVALLAAEQLRRVTPRLIVGQTRLRSDLDLGPSMAVVAERFLGFSIDYLGHIEEDDAVWQTVRRQRPLLIDSPASKSARNIERVARRILALLAAPTARDRMPRTLPPPPQPPPTIGRATIPPGELKNFTDPPPTLYDVLGVARTATDDEIRRASKRQREIFREGGLPVVSAVMPELLRRELARIDEAHDTLLDIAKRRAYDLSTFPDDAPDSAVPRAAITPGRQAELMMLQSELAREINAETIFTGALLRKVRDSQGVEVFDIARVTKVSNAHILAIEAESPTELPAQVYVQGFVQQIARFLKLDAAQVTRTYMRRFRELAAGVPGRGGR